MHSLIQADELEIREATVDDIPHLVGLIAELGYDAGEDSLADAIARLVGSRDKVFVAERGGTIAGLMVVNILQPFHVAKPWGRISALVVTALERGNGTGRLLLGRAESYCRDLDCSKIELTSHESRVDAHRFYRRHGYREAPKRFVKLIES